MKRLIAALLICSSFIGIAAHGAGIWPNGATESTAITLTTPADNQNITFGDTANIDAAGRMRQAGPFGVFEDTRTEDIGATVWEDIASGVGATSTWNSNEATVTLGVGTGATDYLYRQSRYLPYIPGKSVLIKITFVLGNSVTNTTKRVGYFDDSDGIFLQQAGATTSACVRTSTSGSPVDTCIPQANWNLDRMDGSCTALPVSKCIGTSNPSGIRLDTTKTQLLVIDFLWQGVGRVRQGLDIGGKIHYFNEVLNANVKPVPYMATATLPVRFEIRNTGVSAGDATFKQICVSVESEGGFALKGLELSISNGITTRAVTTRAPVIAIRLANTYNGKPNRRTLRILHVMTRAATNDAFCELVHIHDPTATAGGTWTAYPAAISAVEYNVGITSVTAATQHVVNSDYVVTGTGQSATATDTSLEWMNAHSLLVQNAASTQSEMFVVYCTSFASTANVTTELNWVEAK